MAPSPQVFVSHSRKDPNLPFFLEAIAASPLKGVFMEFENIDLPWWKPIKEQVAASVAAFVLLSKPLEELKHTQNWIDFEVGLSCAEDKQVWVFEPQGQEVEFAVPYCTYYCIYNPKEPSEVKRVKWYNDMYSGVIGPATGLYRAPLATCPRENCRLEFHMMMMGDAESFRCPSCRTRFRWNKLTHKVE